MAKLILSVDGQVLKEYQLSKERTLIGRKAHNDIQIDNLAVSGEHAAIITILNDSFIKDLGSTNGTMVNGKPVKSGPDLVNPIAETAIGGKVRIGYMREREPHEIAVVVEDRNRIFPDRLTSNVLPRTPQPSLNLQTAYVVGPPGAPIYMDEYGRAKVQFHWDLDHNYEPDSSCLIRVTSPGPSSFRSTIIPALRARRRFTELRKTRFFCLRRTGRCFLIGDGRVASSFSPTRLAIQQRSPRKPAAATRAMIPHRVVEARKANLISSLSCLEALPIISMAYWLIRQVR